MDLQQGFAIEDPAVFVPWQIDENELRQRLPAAIQIAAGYLVMPCVSLGGLHHQLGFHFKPRENGELVEVELYHEGHPDLAVSFGEFQSHLEATFGPPTTSGPGDEGLPAHIWQLPGAMIEHFVRWRFVPEEIVRIWVV